ncbi:MAG: IS1595 family transposase [Gammaproteobacteria bacterium]
MIRPSVRSLGMRIPLSWPKTFVTENIETHSHVITDGWHGYDNLEAMGYAHESVVLDGDPKKAEKALPMIHLIFSNLKAWLLGTHHGVSTQHFMAYLNEFVFRFNRRFYPMTAFASVLGIGADLRCLVRRALGSFSNPGQSVATTVVSLGVNRIGMECSAILRKIPILV